MKFLHSLYRFLRSIKLAIVIILYLAVSSAISTLIPQGADPALYNQSYSYFVARLIIFLGLHRFFRSLLFLIPLSIFFINLSACTAYRLGKGLRRGAKKRFGPDIIHIGLLLLMIGGVAGLFGRTSELYYLKEGDTLQISDGYEVSLKNFEYQQYEDGRPKDWLSEVEVLKDGEYLRTYTIEVNKPLRIGKVKVFQNSFSRDYEVTVRDTLGNQYSVKPGAYYWSGDRIVVFQEVEFSPDDKPFIQEDSCPPSGYAVFQEMTTGQQGEGSAIKSVYRVAVSEKIDQFTVEKLCIWNLTGLQVVEDFSFIPVIISLTLIGAGMSLTFFQKIKDKGI